MTWRRALPVCAMAAGLAAGPASGQVTLGVSAGRSMSELVVTGARIQGEQSRKGLTAGAWLTLPLPGLLGLRLEASYVQRGATWSDPLLGDVSALVDYVQLSALGRVSVPVVASRVSLHLLAGPAVARETSCEVEVKYVLQPITLSGKCTDEETYNPTHAIDVGVVAGVGAQLAVTEGMGLSLELLYIYGLRSVYAGEFERTVHNRALTVQAGLVFPIG